MTAPGWYPDAQGVVRYFDGQRWTERVAPTRQAIVQGPNHVLHAILSLLTFWFFGGWLWVWLFVALFNQKKIRYL
jgi:hypothetical protein